MTPNVRPKAVQRECAEASARAWHISSLHDPVKKLGVAPIFHVKPSSHGALPIKSVGQPDCTRDHRAELGIEGSWDFYPFDRAPAVSEESQEVAVAGESSAKSRSQGWESGPIP